MPKTYFLLLFIVIETFNLHAYGEIRKLKDQEHEYSTNKLSGTFFPKSIIKGNLFFTLGALESSSSSESLHFTYENKIRINTTFNGSDDLLTIIESGNAQDSPLELDLQSKKGDVLKVSTLLYQFPIGDEIHAIVGPKMFGYNGLAGKSTLYNERLAILDGSNFTTSSGSGPGAGISIRKKNGFNASTKIASNSNEIENESIHTINQVGLTRKNFGGTITSNHNNKFNASGIAFYYKLPQLSSISVAIEQKDGDEIQKTYNWIFALQKKVNNKKFGIAVGTHNDEEEIGFEGWSEIAISDKIALIPVFFTRETNNSKSDLGLALNMQISY
tara:strand:+ start:3775 stop:4764 length:990 start_codon:yes stop_codon:yes gene_type:complete